MYVCTITTFSKTEQLQLLQLHAAAAAAAAAATTTTTTTTTVLWPLNRPTCVSQHLQLRTGRFCWSKVLLHTCRYWRQLSHLVREKTLAFSSTVLRAPSPSPAKQNLRGKLDQVVRGRMQLLTPTQHYSLDSSLLDPAPNCRGKEPVNYLRQHSKISPSHSRHEQSGYSLVIYYKLSSLQMTVRTLLAGWQQRHVDYKSLCHLAVKAVFWNSWRNKNKGTG